jgi:hypothetical protein
MRPRIFRAAAVAALLSTGACHRTVAADPRMVSEWMRTLYGAVRAERLSPPVASRLFAYAGSAMYGGMAAANPALPRLEGRVNGLHDLPAADPGRRYDETLTAVAAEHVVLDSLFREGLPTTRASLGRLADSLVQAQRTHGVGDDERTRSADLGRRVGLAIVAWSHGDGFDSTRGHAYTPPAGQGLWVNDSPATTYATQNLSAASQLIVPSNPTNALKAGSANDRGMILDRQKRGVKTLPAANQAGITEPYWGWNRPFALQTWNECDAPPPPAYGTAAGSPLYDQARLVSEAKTHLTPEQKETVFYWADNAGESGTPAGHWLSIAAQMVSERHLNGEQAAWVMALTSYSLADAFIAAWGYKFHHNLVRPRTFIRANIDSTWEPTIPTPPFPEYIPGHSTVSAAAAATLTGVLGDAAFEDSTSLQIGHPVRKFPSFRAAADEAGMSRIYGGIHFPESNIEGGKVGRCVASKVLARFQGGELR